MEIGTGIELSISGARGYGTAFTKSSRPGRGALRLQSPFPPGAKGWRNAGLVITPKEIGVVQGDLKGRLRWDEIIELRLGGKVEKLQLTSGAERYSIVLSVEGAVFTLGDIYDRPLAIIYERLRRYWRPS